MSYLGERMSQAVETPVRGATVWTIDTDHSEIGFAVKHLMVATVKGSFRRFSGRVILDENNIGKSLIEADIDVASIDTRQEQRDAHLRSADFFDAESFPVMTFRSKKVEQLRHGYLRAVGDLTIRGATREVVLDVEETGRGGDPWGNQRIGYNARTTINRDEFGLTWNQALETGGVLVSADVKINVDLQIVKA
jgi:polyisoprenoid-binding protein YceI